jgi:integrase
LLWGDGTVSQRSASDGTVTWQARWVELDARGVERRRARTFPTKDQAMDHLRKIRRERQAGQYVPESTATVADLTAEYLERARRQWKSNTYSTNRSLHQRLICPHIGSVRVVTLTPRRLQLWVDTLARAGVGPSAIRNAYSIVSASLARAARLGLIDRSPAAGIELPGIRSTERVTWTIPQVRAVLDALAGDAKLLAFYSLAIATGMRPGELRALQWRDVDLTAQAITVRRTITRGEDDREVIGTTTKTGRSRTVIIPAFVAAHLTSWRREQVRQRLAHPHWIDGDLVFDRGDGQFIPGTTVQRIHDRVTASAGVPRIRLHDLRHTYATLEFAHGTNPRIVAERLGHASIAMTLDLYTHVSLDTQHTAAEAMARRLLEGAVEHDNIEGDDRDSVQN